jgi:hypothetical protein
MAAHTTVFSEYSQMASIRENPEYYSNTIWGTLVENIPKIDSTTLLYGNCSPVAALNKFRTSITVKIRKVRQKEV